MDKELNHWLANNVMDWFEGDDPDSYYHIFEGHTLSCCSISIWRPTVNQVQAFRVVEEMIKKGFRFTLDNMSAFDSNAKWSASFHWKRDGFAAQDKPEPTSAICIAAQGAVKQWLSKQSA